MIKMIWIPLLVFVWITIYVMVAFGVTKAAYNAADGVWDNEETSRRLFASVIGFSWPLTVPFAIIFGVGHCVVSSLWKGD